VDEPARTIAPDELMRDVIEGLMLPVGTFETCRPLR
jgi:hypothetical protein